jgi:hypothetical protein
MYVHGRHSLTTGQSTGPASFNRRSIRANNFLPPAIATFMLLLCTAGGVVGLWRPAAGGAANSGAAADLGT